LLAVFPQSFLETSALLVVVELDDSFGLLHFPPYLQGSSSLLEL
jgi:hypothetical protein